MTTPKVYRIGSLAQQSHTEKAIQQWSPFDAVKPMGRAGRLEALYASPTLTGLVRWVRAMHSVNINGDDLDSKEIALVNADDIYVYSVHAYDVARISRNYAAYWNSGIRLSDWEQIAQDKGLDATEWEVLLPFEKIKAAKVISNKRILNATQEDYMKSELVSAFKRRAFLV